MTTPGASAPSTVTAEDFDRVLGTRALQPVFQPLIDLDDRHVVGYEALARGPVGLGPGDAGGPVRDGLAGDPARLLATVAQARQAGFGWPWTTWAPPRPRWPCCRSSAPT